MLHVFWSNLREIVKCWRDGIGMFCEAYGLFAVGNLPVIFKLAYPRCWSEDEEAGPECSQTLIDSITFTEVIGVIVGMLLIGFLGDRYGRRKMSITTACVMFVGSILLTASAGSTVSALFIMFTISLGIFGFGVGGEYPIASASAAERSQAGHKAKHFGGGDATAEAQTEASQTYSRGKDVVLTFSMQGIGNWTNVGVLLLLLWIFGQTTDASANRTQLELVWRLSFALLAAILTALVIYRYYKTPESESWFARGAKRSAGKRTLFFRTYWSRLVASCLGWFFWDIIFYGNRLFQNRFIEIITEDASAFEVLQWTLINASVALVGYFVAAYTIDRRWMGRVRMQAFGFFFLFIAFTVSGIWLDTLTSSSNIEIFQAIYFFTAFIGQVGPNATTWLIPSEIFPTDMRTFAHGLSAASGKLGALFAGISFAIVGDRERFLIAGISGAIGLVLTVIFLPDVSHMDLDETDRYWDAVVERKEFTGAHMDAKNLSLFERFFPHSWEVRTSDDADEVSEHSLTQVSSVFRSHSLV